VLNLEWKVNPFQPSKTLGTDQLYVVLYDVEKDTFITFAQLAVRSALKALVDLPEVYAGDNVHVWIFFVSADGKLTSESDYLGLYRVLA